MFRVARLELGGISRNGGCELRINCPINGGFRERGFRQRCHSSSLQERLASLAMGSLAEGETSATVVKIRPGGFVSPKNYDGLPPAASVEQSIVLAQLLILRDLERRTAEIQAQSEAIEAELPRAA
jgi:hypothetical protein